MNYQRMSLMLSLRNLFHKTPYLKNYLTQMLPSNKYLEYVKIYKEPTIILFSIISIKAGYKKKFKNNSKLKKAQIQIKNRMKIQMQERRPNQRIKEREMIKKNNLKAQLKNQNVKINENYVFSLYSFNQILVFNVMTYFYILLNNDIKNM